MGSVLRLAVMGDRTYSDAETIGFVLEKAVLALCDPRDDTSIASYDDCILLLGGASGVDQTAREWAYRENYSYVLYKPPFMVDPGREHQPADFRVRRKQMVDNCDALLVLKRPGDETFDSSIRRAIKLNKTVIIEEVQDA